MARKKTQPLKPKIPLELTVDRNEAKQKLEERIEKGKEIRSIEINNQQNLNEANKEYKKWNDFNGELLKRLFTSDELHDEYYFWGGGVFGMREPHLTEKIADFHKDIDTKILRLESMVERLELIPESSTAKPVSSSPRKNLETIDKSKIFVVHGHDDSAKLEVARFIEKIGFDPIILNEQASESKTVIEKIESYSDVGFGVVIYTACDVGKKNSSKLKLKGRARQNVVFEHGFLIGKLGRSKVCQLVKGDVETPNDISGIVYTSMDSGNWKIELAKELRAAKYPVDMNKVIY